MSGRYIGEKVSIDMHNVEAFFKDRFSRSEELHPLAPVIYQDNNYDLAAARDKYEKEALLNKMQLSGTESVLDIGCGIGRWADALYGKVKIYHGTDLISGFIDIASREHKGKEDFFFTQLDARNLDLLRKPLFFDLALVAGVFIYLNDEDVPKVLNSLTTQLKKSSRIIIREPLAIKHRLTLKGIWSEDLKSSYSAIYRNRDEFERILDNTVISEGYRVVDHGELYPDDLNNRQETRQFYYILERD